MAATLIEVIETGVTILHIISGLIALSSSFVAIGTKTFKLKHKWHVIGGTLFVGGMSGIFITAIGLLLFRYTFFLVLIAIFSYYMTLMGWRFAKNREGTPQKIDWFSIIIMLIASVVMIGFGIISIINGDPNGIVSLVFGVIGGSLSRSHFIIAKNEGTTGRERIRNHLGSMMGATIATLTAFLVVNFRINPQLILWLAPTVVITPIIMWWDNRIASGESINLGINVFQ